MYEAVREDCTKALELDPRYVKALLRRARALEKLGEFEPALDDVSTACILEGFSNTTSLTLADRILEQLGESCVDHKVLVSDNIANRALLFMSECED